MNVVADASAVLAYLHQERGWESVREALGAACISAVNWSEVAQKSGQKALNPALVRPLLTELGLVIVPFSADQAELAATLWSSTRTYGLSLADRACLALALERQIPVLTADKNWTELNLGIEVRLLR